MFFISNIKILKLAIDFLGGTKSSMDDDETSDARKEGVAYMYIILAGNNFKFFYLLSPSYQLNFYYYFYFLGICFLATLFIVFFVPETKGLFLFLHYFFEFILFICY